MSDEEFDNYNNFDEDEDSGGGFGGGGAVGSGGFTSATCQTKACIIMEEQCLYPHHTEQPTNILEMHCTTSQHPGM